MTSVALRPFAADDLRAAAREIAPYVHRTPLVSSSYLSARLGYEVRLKAENLQKTGSFKARGAHFRISQLAGKTPGVVTYSSGNHGQAVALAARNFGLAAIVVVPEDASPAKTAAIREYGATVEPAGTTSLDRMRRAGVIARERSFTVVPPFDDPGIVAGQATAALEILDDWPEVARIAVPVGGGGLVAGTISAIRALGRDVEILAVEPEGAPTLATALAAGEIVTLDRVETIADGLRPVRIGELPFSIAREFPVRSVLVSDRAILEALALLLERTKILAEPSGAAALAALLASALEPCPTAVLVSGGNIDPRRLSELLAR